MAVIGLILAALGSVGLVVVREGRAATTALGVQWLGLVLAIASFGVDPSGGFRLGREAIVEFITAFVCIAVILLTLRGLQADKSEIRNPKSEIEWRDYVLPAITTLLGGLAGVGFASVFPFGAPESDLAFYWTAISGLLVLTVDGARNLTKLAVGLLALLNATALLIYTLSLPTVGAVPVGLTAIMRVGLALVLAYGLLLSVRLFGSLTLGALLAAEADSPETADAPQAQSARLTPYMAGAIILAATLLAWALLTDNVVTAALCLLGVELLAAVTAGLPLATGSMGNRDPRRLAGGLKRLSMATLATGLLATGGLILARFSINPENTGALQIGLGLLAVGLIVRAGAVPFAAGSADFMSSAPVAAILTLGAACPAVIIVGLRAFDGIASGAAWAGRDVALWMAAAGALLAGLRALSARTDDGRWTMDDGRWTMDRQSALLATSAVALQVSWALFGVFSGSQQGAMGATILAISIAIFVPLMFYRPSSVVHRRAKPTRPSSVVHRRAKPTRPSSVVHRLLLVLPTLVGFMGMMLVAQAAAERGGSWLGTLLLGTVLAGAGGVRRLKIED